MLLFRGMVPGLLDLVLFTGDNHGVIPEVRALTTYLPSTLLLQSHVPACPELASPHVCTDIRPHTASEVLPNGPAPFLSFRWDGRRKSVTVLSSVFQKMPALGCVPLGAC